MNTETHTTHSHIKNEHPAKITGTLLATSFGFVVVQLDVTIVNVAMPQIGTDLMAGVTGLQWIVDSYTLTFAALLLTAGVFGDRFGSRRVFTTGLILFGLASLACAVAPSIDILIIARSLQGIGAALILPTSLSLLSHACSGDSMVKAKAIGWWTAIGGMVSALGPVAGGLLTSGLGWRSIFFVNLPICLLGLWASRRYVTETVEIKNQRLDVIGQILAFLSLFFLTHSVIDAGMQGWGDKNVLVGLAIALLAVILFLINEAYVASPMIPLSLFRNRILSAAVVLGMLSNLTFYALIFVLSIYFQKVKGYTPTQTGIALLPFTVIMLANIASGYLAKHFSLRMSVIVGGLLSALSFALLHGINEDTAYLRILPSLLLLAIGSGISTPALTSAILGSVDSSRSATASAIFNASRQIGSALGVALFGILLTGSLDEMAVGAAFSFDISLLIRIAGVILAALFL